MPVGKKCERCGKPFKVRPRDAAQRFCCFACKTAHESVFGRENAQVPTVSFQCKICSKPFSYKPSIVRAYRKKWGKDPQYCSTKCGGIGRQLSDEQWQVTCVQCGKLMPIQRKPGGTVNRQKHLCSTECRALFRRLDYQKRHPEQAPTTRMQKNGYIRIIIPGKDGKPSRETFEHRYVMEQHLGRELYPEETVHHKDGNRQHNALENLELFSSRHGPGQRVIDKVQFAIDMLRLYPDFARAAGFELHQVAHTIGQPSAPVEIPTAPTAPHGRQRNPACPESRSTA